MGVSKFHGPWPQAAARILMARGPSSHDECQYVRRLRYPGRKPDFQNFVSRFTGPYLTCRTVEIWLKSELTCAGLQSCKVSYPDIIFQIVCEHTL